MSKYMLCDNETINDINPYVSRDFSLPGGVRQIPDFADHAKDMTREGRQQKQLSPICDIASTSGDRTIDFCTGGRQPPCPLARPLEPRRNIDLGWTTSLQRNGNGAEKVVTTQTKTENMFSCIIFIILTFLVVWFVRR